MAYVDRDGVGGLELGPDLVRVVDAVERKGRRLDQRCHVLREEAFPLLCRGIPGPEGENRPSKRQISTL